jgi:hypothetical protein
MSLLEQVAAMLDAAGAPYALIGASAMPAYGVNRATLDIDLLTIGNSYLDSHFWESLRDSGVQVEVRQGDLTDPLAGVVRFESPEEGERPLDLVVGKFIWQRKALERAVKTGEGVPLIRAADLILLKLYAGGAQDAWDIHQLLAGEDRDDLIQEVEALLPDLPSRCASFWKDVLRP